MLKRSFLSKLRTAPYLFGALLAPVVFLALPANAQAFWGDYAGGPQHTALSTTASQSLSYIHWQTPVDLQPQFNGNDLLIHYGAPLVTQANTILLPVKTGAADGFKVEALRGSDGSLLWSFASDFTLPAHNWTPSYGPAITPAGRLYMAGAGGTVYYRDNIDSPTPGVVMQVAFYGTATYNANKSAFNTDVQICTPLTSDSSGNIYFGFRVTATVSLPITLTSGLARLGADGSMTYVAASTATVTSTEPSIQVAMNCAPALSNNGKTVYVAMNNTPAPNGNLVALDSTSLATTGLAHLVDPQNGNDAIVLDDSSATPMVGPDDIVYYGVLENPLHSSKGWMLHFSADLTQKMTPSAFGWDDTASIVPANMVPSYHGTSAYLLMCKYNNYAGGGGDGVNKLAILDPNDTQVDSRTGTTVMKEVLKIAGVTPDPEFPGVPGAVREWCINTAVVDPFTDSVLANSEDGKLYRWNLTTNTFTENVTLTPGVGEAYTPTIIGRDGTVYAINNATLFAVGQTAADVSGQVSISRDVYTYVRSSGTYRQNVTVTNIGGATINGPISLILSSLTNATLNNATGVTGAILPAGRPYIDLGVSSLAPGAHVTIALVFTKTGAGSISYSTQVAGGLGSR